MADKKIMGIHIYDRHREAGEVQKVLTQFGCSIKTRLGLHEVHDEYCSDAGLIVLQLIGDEEEINEMEASLISIPGVKIQKMVFSDVN